MRESDFQNWVVEVARRFGWLVFHVPAPMRATKQGFVGAKEAAGLADLIMFHDDPPRLVFAELKGPKGKLSDKQREFLQAVHRVSHEAIACANVRGERVLDSYAWAPGQEASIEALLRSRVLS